MVCWKPTCTCLPATALAVAKLEASSQQFCFAVSELAPTMHDAVPHDFAADLNACPSMHWPESYLTVGTTSAHISICCLHAASPCRGFKLQGAFACLGTSAAAAAAVMSADKQAKMMWALSGALMFAVFPYTMVALMPHTKKIMRKVGWDADDHVLTALVTGMKQHALPRCCCSGSYRLEH